MKLNGWVMEFTSAEREVIRKALRHEQVAHGFSREVTHEQMEAFLERVLVGLGCDGHVVPPRS